LHEPLAVVNQVAIIYAGVNGFLDDVPVAQVPAFEARLYETLGRQGESWVRLFNERKAMDPDVKAGLEAILKDLKGVMR
jgi:F-type H+-transporting ATPase subunit alpha